SDGRQLIDTFHLRSNAQQFMKVGYAADGITPKEITFLSHGKAPSRMTLDPKQNDTWNAEVGDGMRAIPMKVRVADSPIPMRDGGSLPAGTLVIIMNPGTPNALTRAFSPNGVEVQENKDGQRVFAPPTQQRETVPDPRDPRNRRQDLGPGQWRFRPG